MTTHTDETNEPKRISVPGFEEHEIAHLSDGQRRKLLEERKTGRKAVGTFAKAAEYNRRLVEQASGGEQPTLDPEAITAARLAERNLAQIRAAEQQAINAQANAAKEAADQNETLLGREAVSLTLAGAITEPAGDLVGQRIEQAEEAGLGAGQATHGHPDNSDAQADAAQTNAAKEVADRAGAGGGDPAPFQGYGQQDVTVQRIPSFDSSGTLMGVWVGDKFERDEDYDGDEQPLVPEHLLQNVTDPNTGVVGTEAVQAAPSQEAQEQARENPESPADNGQAQQTSEPDAATLAAGLGTDDDTSKKSRGRKAAAKAPAAGPVGSGPKSE